MPSLIKTRKRFPNSKKGRVIVSIVGRSAEKVGNVGFAKPPQSLGLKVKRYDFQLIHLSTLPHERYFLDFISNSVLLLRKDF